MLIQLETSTTHRSLQHRITPVSTQQHRNDGRNRTYKQKPKTIIKKTPPSNKKQRETRTDLQPHNQRREDMNEWLTLSYRRSVTVSRHFHALCFPPNLFKTQRLPWKALIYLLYTILAVFFPIIRLLITVTCCSAGVWSLQTSTTNSSRRRHATGWQYT